MMFYLKSSRKFIFLTNYKYFHLWYFQTQITAQEKEIYNLPILDYPKCIETTKIWRSNEGRLIVLREITTKI